MATWAQVADIANVTARDTFGISVTYTAQTQPAAIITAVFDEAHDAVEVRAGVAVTTTGPALDVRLSDLSVTPRLGDTVVVSGTTYRVMDYQPTGNGDAKLLLSV